MHENKQIIFVAEKRRTISGNKNQSRGKHMTWMPNPLRATGKAVIIIFPPPAPVLITPTPNIYRYCPGLI